MYQGSHIYWKTWKNLVHLENLEKSWNFAKHNKNHGNIMEFFQAGNVGTLGYCGNDIFLIRWNFYVNNDPKVTGSHIKNIQKKYLEFFFEKPGKIMEKSWNFVSPEMWEPCVPWVSKPLWSPWFHALSSICNSLLRFTSGVTPCWLSDDQHCNLAFLIHAHNCIHASIGLRIAGIFMGSQRGLLIGGLSGFHGISC